MNQAIRDNIRIAAGRARGLIGRVAKLARVDVLAFGLLLCVGGCNIVTPVSYLVFGPEKVEAQYKLKDVPTVVYIDDRQNVVNPVSLRRIIADTASADIMQFTSVKTTISGQDAMSIVSQKERSNKVMSIEDIGNAVGAQQVIYVEMQMFAESPDGATPKPTAQATVRVIDIAEHLRVFPPADGTEKARSIQASLRITDPSELRNAATRAKVMQDLAKETGVVIGKLFYKHEPRNLGSNLTPQ
jgi:hypothetical protein